MHVIKIEYQTWGVMLPVIFCLIQYVRQWELNLLRCTYPLVACDGGSYQIIYLENFNGLYAPIYSYEI